MTIDERLDRLTERHEALAQSTELLLAAQRENAGQIARLTDRVDRLTEHVDGLTESVAGLTETVAGLTETVAGLADRMISLTGHVETLTDSILVVSKLVQAHENRLGQLGG